MNYQSPLARVIGLGSAKSGSAHWWWQRLTALALIPLALWFTYSIARFSGSCIADIYTWVASPVTSTLLIAFVISLFYHTQLGIQVVLEDYVGREGIRILSILTVKALSVMLAILSIISVLQVALTGQA